MGPKFMLCTHTLTLFLAAEKEKGRVYPHCGVTMNVSRFIFIHKTLFTYGKV